MKPTPNQRAALREWALHNGYGGAFRKIPGYTRIGFHVNADRMAIYAIRYMSLVDFPRTIDEATAIIWKCSRFAYGGSTYDAVRDRAHAIWTGATGLDEPPYWAALESHYTDELSFGYSYTPARTMLERYFCWVCGRPIFIEQSAVTPSPYFLVHDRPPGKRGPRCRNTKVYAAFRDLSWKRVRQVHDLIQRTASSPEVFHLVRLRLSIYGVQNEISAEQKAKREQRKLASQQNERRTAGCTV